jgi:hypothetical protein
MASIWSRTQNSALRGKEACRLLNSTSQLLSSIACCGIGSGYKISSEKRKNSRGIEVRWACRPGTWAFISATNPTCGIIFGQSLRSFTTALAGRPGNRDSIPGGDRDFVHHGVQTGPGAHPASYAMVTEGSQPETVAAGA